MNIWSPFVLGFLTHHLALTNSFEASLRSVDPSVTLPYWDFTIEGQQILIEEQAPSYMLQVCILKNYFDDSCYLFLFIASHILNRTGYSCVLQQMVRIRRHRQPHRGLSLGPHPDASTDGHPQPGAQQLRLHPLLLEQQPRPW